MQRVRSIGRDGGVATRRVDPSRGKGWRIVGVDEVVREPRMIGVRRVQLFERRRSGELLRVRLVRGIGGGEHRERVEDLRLRIVRIVLRDV